MDRGGGGGEEAARSERDELRRRAYNILTPNADTSVRYITAANFTDISNDVNNSFFAARFARRRDISFVCKTGSPIGPPETRAVKTQYLDTYEGGFSVQTETRLKDVPR